MTTKILAYRQDYPKEWLKKHPQEAWRCDIFPDDGSDHHGIGKTEADAIMSASMAYARWSAKP